MRVFYSIDRLAHTYPTVSDYASEDTPTGTSYEQRQELTEDYKSCYKQSTLPCSSEECWKRQRLVEVIEYFATSLYYFRLCQWL